jgi:RNA polymerase sigma-70 factor (ECF subfamily)
LHVHAADAPTLKAAQRGDRAALAILLRELEDPWYRFSLSLLGDGERAREAVQETGLRFLKTLPGFRGESRLQTWSLGIALNVVREMRRKARPMADHGQQYLAAATAERQAPQSPLSQAEHSEHTQKLREVLHDLPERQREAISLRFFEELSVEETARAMNCAEGTVKATVHQALRSLKNKLSAAVAKAGAVPPRPMLALVTAGVNTARRVAAARR